MRRTALATLIAGVGLCLGVVTGAVAQGGPDPTPTVFDVTPTSAQVTAKVKPPGDVGSYHLEWGTDGSFGERSEPIALGVKPGVRVVGGTLTGLLPATTYHVRVVVTGEGDPVVSPGVGFTTAADPNPSPSPGPEAGEGAQLEPAQTVENTPPDPADAEQGEAVVLGPESGEITVKQAGTDRYAVLEAGTPVPVGSIVDARRGTLRLISEAAGQDKQEVILRGGRFEVRQAKDGSGITEFVLRGGNFSACGRARSAGSRPTRTVRRSLWARDRGGRFRTRGRNSVATVRGTTWRVTDTCAGTTTSVSSGSVTVRELRTGRTVVVRKGGKYRARAAR
jgi:hypothetical protein